MKARFARAAAGALVVAALLGACGSGSEAAPPPSTAPPPTPLELVTSAWDKAAEVRTARVALVFGRTELGERVTGEGTLDLASGRAGFRILAGVPRDEGSEVVVDGMKTYVRVEPDEFTEGKPWMMLDFEAVAASGNLAAVAAGTAAGGFDPSLSLLFLEGAGAVQEVGAESLRGAITTHYRATVDLDRAAAALTGVNRRKVELAIMGLGELPRAFPVDVWLDDAGLPREVQYEQPRPGVLDETRIFALRATVELFDYGAATAIIPPAAAQVYDYGAFLTAEP